MISAESHKTPLFLASDPRFTVQQAFHEFARVGHESRAYFRRSDGGFQFYDSDFVFHVTMYGTPDGSRFGVYRDYDAEKSRSTTAAGI